MQTDAQKRWERLPLAVQSFSLEEFNVYDVIKHARKLGVRFIEFFHGHLSPWSESAEIISLKKALNRAGVSIAAYGLYKFTNNHEDNRKAFDFATLPGIKNITAEVDA